MRCPFCGTDDTQVKGLATDRRSRCDSAAPLLSELRGTLYDFRACSAARINGDKEERTA